MYVLVCGNFLSSLLPWFILSIVVGFTVVLMREENSRTTIGNGHKRLQPTGMDMRQIFSHRNVKNLCCEIFKNAESLTVSNSSNSHGDDGNKGSRNKRHKALKSHSTQKPRVFVGQLSYKTTKKAIQDLFEQRGIKNVTVRLLTQKGTNKSRGMAFVELPDEFAVTRALRIHHQMLMGDKST